MFIASGLLAVVALVFVMMFFINNMKEFFFHSPSFIKNKGAVSIAMLLAMWVVGPFMGHVFMLING